jgi:hypothetical protein
MSAELPSRCSVVSVPDLTEHLTCAVCFDVWCQPTMLRPCQHIFCAQCVHAITKCPVCRECIACREKPHKVILNMTDEVRVRCSGCNWEGTRAASNRHRCSGVLARAEPAPLCPSGHPMTPVPRLPNDYTPGSWSCDRCRCRIADDSASVVHCSECSYDLCATCVVRGPLRCQKDHELRTISGKPQTYVGQWMCDCCQALLDPGTKHVAHCSICSYDLCPSCCRAFA